MVDASRAFEVQDGFLVEGGPFYTGGTAPPIGLDLPTNTFYVQSLGRPVIWQKFGAGVNDWRIFPASDIAFDPTGLLNLEPTDNNLQLAVAKLGNQNFGDLAQIDGFASPAFEDTTSNNFVSKQGFPFTSSPKTAGQISVQFTANIGQTLRNRKYSLRVMAGPTGGTMSQLALVPLFNSRDNSSILQSGFGQITLPADGTVDVDVGYGDTDNGGSCTIQDVAVIIQRIGD